EWLGGRRCEQRRSALIMPNDDIGHIAGEQAIDLQRIDIVSNRSEQTHVSVHARGDLGRAPPYWLAGSCQRRLKRTLRMNGGRRPGPVCSDFGGGSPADFRGMGDGQLPGARAPPTRQAANVSLRGPSSLSHWAAPTPCF